MSDLNVQKLTVTTLAERMRHLPAINYVNATALVKSAVVVVSASTALQIARADIASSEMLLRGYFWCLTALLAGITHITWNRGYLFTASRVGILDFFTPIWVGVAEILLFMVCDPTTETAVRSLATFPELWLVIAAMHSAACASLVGNRVYETNEEDFEEQLRTVPFDRKGRPLSKAYIGWIKRDLIATTSNTFLLFIAFGIVKCGLLAAYIQPAYLAAAGGTLIVVPSFIGVSVACIYQIKEVEDALVNRKYA